MVELVVLCFDGLEPDIVEDLNVRSLLQIEHGRTDTAGLRRQTHVLWASFLTGLSRIPSDLRVLVTRKWFEERDMPTLLDIEGSVALSMPPIMKWGQNLSKYVYNAFANSKHRPRLLEEQYKVYETEKQQTLEALKKNPSLALSHFIIPDHIGHVFRMEELIMERLYKELGRFVDEVKDNIEGEVLVVSDHGMETRPVTARSKGKYGYHAQHGFYSISERWNLANPMHISKFYDAIIEFFDRKRVVKRLRSLGY